MDKNEEKIEYSADELREIDKIVDHISKETLGHLSTNMTSAGVDVEHSIDTSEEDSYSQFKNGNIAMQEKFEEIPEELEISEAHEEIQDEEQEEIQEETEMSEESADEIQDITDIIKEIPEEIPYEDISFTEEKEEEPVEELSESAEYEKEEGPEPGEEEPEFDLSLIAEDLEQYQTEEELPAKEIKSTPAADFKTPETEEAKQEPLIDEGVLKDFDSIGTGVFGDEEPQAKKLPDVSREEKTAGLEVSDLDITQMAPAQTISEEAADIEDSAMAQVDDDFLSIDREEQKKTKSTEKTPVADKPVAEPDFSADLDKIDDLIGKGLKSPVIPDIGLIEPLEAVPSPDKPGEEEIDLTDSELKKLNKAIMLFHPDIVKVIKDVILNDLLPGNELRKLVDMLLSSKREEEIKSFLEKKLNTKIDISQKAALQRRRVISARPEYTKEGRERQTRLLKATGIFAAGAVIVLLATFFSYQYIYKPVMAKKNIDEGVSLITKPGVPVLEKQRDYKKAEDIFIYVNEKYIKDYLYGYHSYAKAYLHDKEYDYALEKLNKAFDINAANVDTLNNLGYFYSKIPELKFLQIKPELQKYYYKKIKPVGPVEKQIDVAIDFYKKALNLDPKNVTALYGIGNAYSHLGESLKAKQYYENILAVDKNSVIGYSGLINLYIEKDALPEVMSIHSSLVNSNKYSQLPSALLAKLSAYFLSKKRTDENNIRIDYGIESPEIKDFNDNPFPYVKNVLDSLAKRDIDYPPLFLQSAKLAKEENNITLMKRNLLTALEKEPDYFAAHILLAEYYYQTKNPVEAYKSCKKAIQAHLSPPDFTKEDFYSETENIGKAYAIMGNIFYYFDNIKFRFGDEFIEENVQENSDQLAYYAIAQDKYEKAIAEKYKSNEIFYNLGRIYYIKGQYDKAATTWLNLYEDFAAQPELLFALGNAFYHQNNLEACKGEYLKVISFFEGKADSITHVLPDRAEHIKIFQTLSSAYNNLGAVYQVQNSESKSNISYWKSIDYAKKIDRENEFARVNLARAFRSGRGNVLPILDENIVADIYAYR